jgi:hypothetical protein
MYFNVSRILNWVFNIPYPSGCDSKMSNSTYLSEHLKDVHNKDPTHIPSDFDMIKPLSFPIKPSLPLPPPLPPNPLPWNASPHVATAKVRNRDLSALPPQSSRWKRRRLDDKQCDDTQDEPSIVCDDLVPATIRDGDGLIPELPVRRKNPELAKQMSYPQSISATLLPPKKPPISVHFEALARQVAEQTLEIEGTAES